MLASKSLSLSSIALFHLVSPPHASSSLQSVVIVVRGCLCRISCHNSLLVPRQLLKRHVLRVLVIDFVYGLVKSLSFEDIVVRVICSPTVPTIALIITVIILVLLAILVSNLGQLLINRVKVNPVSNRLSQDGKCIRADQQRS